MSNMTAYENNLHLEATELRLGLPGRDECENHETRNNKRPSPEASEERGARNNSFDAQHHDGSSPPAKAQIVGWPPVRSFSKSSQQIKKSTETEAFGSFVKVSMDGAPYLRKIDLRLHKCYPELLKALENMFTLTIGVYSEREGYEGSEYSPTYEDKDGDWMLVGDVPWTMFMSSCKRLRIVKGSEARGLACAA